MDRTYYCQIIDRPDIAGGNILLLRLLLRRWQMTNHPHRSRTVRIALARQEIVRLRNLAAWQRDDYAQSHYRQAQTPIYPGQEMICIGKAQQAERLSAANDAAANVLEARIEAIEARKRKT